MWDFFETVRHRHSIRKYLDSAVVETDKLHAVLEMACAAPSAGDLQAYRIFVIRDQALRRQLSQAADNQQFIASAPVDLVFCADPDRSAQRFGERGRRLYAIQDATIAATYAQLAVVAAGMGSTWVGDFNEGDVTELLGLGEGLVPVAILSLGYPAELPEPTPRRRMDQVVVYLD
jgi:nitroreductase